MTDNNVQNKDQNSPIGAARRGSGGPRRVTPGRRGGGGRRDGGQSGPPDFEQKILELKRVTRVTAGGKRMSFRAVVIAGDKKGRVGMGIAKGLDVQMAAEKAFRRAKKTLLRVPLVAETIPFPVRVKFSSAEVLIKPAPKGTGLKCGGAVRTLFELAGVPNVVSKILRSSNKINIAKATLVAIKALHQTPIGLRSKEPSPAK